MHGLEHTHAACQCPCCMFMSLLHVHVYVACPCPPACPCSCCISIRIECSCPSCMSMSVKHVHVRAAYSCPYSLGIDMNMQHEQGHAGWTATELCGHSTRRASKRHGNLLILFFRNSTDVLLVHWFSGLAEVGSGKNLQTVNIPLIRQFFVSPLIGGFAISGTPNSVK
jgi:hypothetical protein